jgi:hypothetical protein
MLKKRMPVDESQRETGAVGCFLLVVVPDNRPDIGLVAGPERALT